MKCSQQIALHEAASEEWFPEVIQQTAQENYNLFMDNSQMEDAVCWMIFITNNSSTYIYPCENSWDSRVDPLTFKAPVMHSVWRLGNSMKNFCTKE